MKVVTLKLMCQIGFLSNKYFSSTHQVFYSNITQKYGRVFFCLVILVGA